MKENIASAILIFLCVAVVIFVVVSCQVQADINATCQFLGYPFGKSASTLTRVSPNCYQPIPLNDAIKTRAATLTPP